MSSITRSRSRDIYQSNSSEMIFYLQLIKQFPALHFDVAFRVEKLLKYFYLYLRAERYVLRRPYQFNGGFIYNKGWKNRVEGVKGYCLGGIVEPDFLRIEKQLVAWYHFGLFL